MGISNYEDFTSKEQLIRGTTIVNTEYEVDLIFKQFTGFLSRKDDNKLIFRGIKEAKFKLYTSAQINWNKLYKKISFKKYITNLTQ